MRIAISGMALSLRNFDQQIAGFQAARRCSPIPGGHERSML
jgi:hypothetical protein